MVKINKGFEILCNGKLTDGEEFCRSAERIASALNARGIGRGKAVILKMPRTERLIIAALGIIRSGATLVPVDSDIPLRRLEVIGKACNAALVLNDSEYECLYSAGRADSLCDENTFSDDDTAFIIFTSGSTGNPKGVCYNRKAFLKVLNFIGVYFTAEGFEFGDVISMTSPSFLSFYYYEIGPALYFGRRLVLATEDEKNSPNCISALIGSCRNPLIFMTPSKYAVFLDTPGFREYFNRTPIRIAGGEKLSDDLKNIILEDYPEHNVKLVNGYGTTECGIIFWNELSEGKYFEDNAALIDGEICALDEDRFSRYIGGNIEKKTVEYEGKCYIRTGDSGVRASDGSIRVLGRFDRMIKLHGLRIELDEIENQIKHIEGVNAVAVVFDEEKQNIHCFYTSDSAIAEEIFVNALKDRLPSYMIPSDFNRLDELPLNAHAKIDYPQLKKAASSYGIKHAVRGFDVSQDPVTPEEKLLIDTVEKVLGVESVSLSDSLRAIGLDSMSGIKLVNKLENEGYSLSLSDIILCADIKALSGRLKRVEYIENRNYRVKSKYEVTDFFLRYVIDRQFEGNNRMAKWCEDSFIVRKSFTESQWRERADKIQRKHPALRSVFSKPNASAYIQTISPEPIGKIDYFDLTDSASVNDGSVTAGQKQIIDSYINAVSSNKAPSNINENVTLALFRISKDYSVIFMLLSHAVADGTSVAILRKELSEDNVSPDEDSFYEYMAWREAEETRQKAIDFNREYLKGAVPAVFPVPENKEKKMLWPDFRISLIPVGSRDSTRGYTPFIYALQNYGKAAMKTLHLDSLVMLITSSGRNIPVRGMDSTVGGLANRLFIKMNKDEETDAFIENLNQAENCFCMPVEELVRNLGDGYSSLLKINLPILVSDVFDDLSGGKVVGQYKERPRDVSGINSYLFRKGDEYFLQTGYNGAVIDSAEFESFLSELREEIREDIT